MSKYQPPRDPEGVPPPPPPLLPATGQSGTRQSGTRQATPQPAMERAGSPMTESGERVLRAIRRIVHAVDIYSKRVERRAGVTVPQLVILRAVRELGEVTTSRLSATVSLSPATAVTILDKLEARGLIERYRSATDRRVVHARMTDAGHAVLATAPGLLHDRFLQRFESLSPEHQAALVQSLDDIVAMMDAPQVDDAPMLGD